MKQVRSRVFETNSSSTHSITICTAEEFEKFSKGELLYDDWNEKLVPASEKEEYDGQLVTLDKFGRDGCGYMENYVEPFTMPSGNEMVAFGIYGYNGQANGEIGGNESFRQITETIPSAYTMTIRKFGKTGWISLNLTQLSLWISRLPNPVTKCGVLLL